ncbi:unnamed protein product [Sordaria macrospora k-hell]|uniref:WGS project CABT00000000 data, contig 2.597 n=1 Tax=Sordaria macrospora (strain ATCC MYA-333 / DSM 997 / K(L3346) / K-hell) TaxID=771870 RepID=F7WD08_SORMK|nr:unnamed protein product [Sordaria macrospora k-hell]
MPTRNARVTAPPTSAASSSPVDSGGISSAKLELAKALLSIAIAINPGATKSGNGTPSTVRPAPPIATEKMTRNSNVVTAGAQIV